MKPLPAADADSTSSTSLAKPKSPRTPFNMVLLFVVRFRMSTLSAWHRYEVRTDRRADGHRGKRTRSWAGRRGGAQAEDWWTDRLQTDRQTTRQAGKQAGRQKHTILSHYLDVPVNDMLRVKLSKSRSNISGCTHTRLLEAAL